MKVSENTSISMPMKNLISIIGAVAIGVWAYFGVTEKLNNHSTKLMMIEKDNLKASAKAKLMAGEALTEEEAKLTLHL